MASTKINSVDLGPIWVQSGFGIPDHFAHVGTNYTDLNTSIVYINTSLNNWIEQISASSFTGGTGGISGSGNTNTISKFNSSTSISNSHISDDIDVFIDSNLEINSAKTISIGVNYVVVDDDILSGGTY